MKNNLLLTTVLICAFIGDASWAVDVSNWNDLKSTEAVLTLAGDVTDPATTSTGNPIKKQNITQTISGGESKHTIDGATGGIDGFIRADTGANLTVENLTVTNFKKARLINAAADATINISNSTFKDNSYDSNGGALFFGSTGRLKLTDVNFTGNSGKGGGALYFSKGVLEMDGGMFANNTSTSSAGALYMGGSNAKSTIKNVTFEANTANSSAGAVYIDIKNAPVEIDNVKFIGNESKVSMGGGGALEVAGTFDWNVGQANTATVKNSSFKGNKTPNSDGGAIALDNHSSLTVENTEFVENAAKYTGGAIMTTEKSILTIKNSTFVGNSTGYDSGAVGVNGALDVYGSTFAKNHTVKQGGAIWGAYYIDHANIISSTFSENYSDSIGGAVYLENSDVKILDATFAENHARYGGAAYIKASTPYLVDVDFSGNYADEGGAVYFEGSDANIFADNKDVIFHGNIAHNDDFTDLANSYNGGGAIYFDGSNKLSLNAAAGRKIVFDDTVASYGDNTIDINVSGLTYANQDGVDIAMGNSGEIQFNNFVGDQDNIFNINLWGGTLSIGQNSQANADGYINFNKFYIKGDGTLNTANNALGEFAPQTFEIDAGVNWRYKFDVSLADAESDKLVGAANNGNLTLVLADLNIMNDAAENETRVSYADTNLNAVLSGNKITTSDATYAVAAENTDAGAFLIFTKQAESAAGLAAAIQNKSDVYAITNGADETVDKWSTNIVGTDLVINANGAGITAENNLDGIIVDENNALTLNDAKHFSGFNNAFVVAENAELNVNDSNLTGNAGDAVISNRGNVNISALKSDVLIARNDAAAAIASDGGTISVGGQKTVLIDGDIAGVNNAEMKIATDMIVGGTVTDVLTTQNAGVVTVGGVSGGEYVLNGGTLNLAGGMYDVSSTVLAGGNINMTNGRPDTMLLGGVVLSGTTNLSVDANLATTQMDGVSASGLEYNGGAINVHNINLMGQTDKSSVTMQFADDVLKEYVTTDVKSVMGEIYKYSVDYDKNTGNFTFSGGGDGYDGFNPAVLSGAVAAQLGGYLTQLHSYDEAFHNMDMYKYMVMTQQQRHSINLRNKYNAAYLNLTHDEGAPYTYNSVRVRPYASFEKVGLKNGPKVSNTAYGSFAGAESRLYYLGNGWDGVFGTYIGYNGSKQTYNGIDIRQNGATLGMIGAAYKGNFFTGLTVNTGMNDVTAGTMYGDDDFSMLMAGIASKTGYNIEQYDGKFIIQPNVLLSYSFVNVSDYTNVAGIKIDSKPLSAIQVEPGVKLFGNLANGWRPYSNIGAVLSAMDKTEFHANDAVLPELSVKPYMKYGVGVRKVYGDRLTGFVQCDLTHGGRNGVGLQAGFRLVIGR